MNTTLELPEGARAWTTRDKSDWGDGSWQSEPDKLQWIDPETDLDCLIVRNHGGALCGYVGLPPGHPLHGADYNVPEVAPHGGLTFSGACQAHAAEDQGVCHVPAPGRPHDVWWLGFDCAHCFDLSPAMEATLRYSRRGLATDPRTPSWLRTFAVTPRSPERYPEEVYRDLPYVISQVRLLAKQLAEHNPR